MADFDLHLHSEWSYDAKNPIEGCFGIAQKKGMRALAITDHHLMDGCDEVPEVAAKCPEVGYLSGAELTVHCGVKDCGGGLTFAAVGAILPYPLRR